MRIAKVSKTAALIALGVALAAVAGVAYGAINSGGVIHGCYAATSPHTLQVIDPSVTASCPSGTAALNWNQRGPSNAYAAFHDADIVLSTSGTNLLSFDLKAGSYVVQAKTVLRPGGCTAVGPTPTGCEVQTFPSCKLQAGFDFDTTSAGAQQVTFSQGGAQRPSARFPTGLIVVHSATAPFRVTFSCTDGTTPTGGGLNSVAAVSKVVAIKVGSLVNTPQ